MQTRATGLNFAQSSKADHNISLAKGWTGQIARRQTAHLFNWSEEKYVQAHAHWTDAQDNQENAPSPGCLQMNDSKHLRREKNSPHKKRQETRTGDLGKKRSPLYPCGIVLFMQLTPENSSRVLGLNVLLQSFSQFYDLLAWIRNNTQRNVDAETLVERVSELDHLERINTQLHESFSLNFCERIAICLLFNKLFEGFSLRISPALWL